MPHDTETTPTRDQVIDRTREILAKQEAIDVAELSEKSHLRADVYLDSLGMIEMSMAIEDAFDITVPDEAVDRVQTIGDVADEIMALLAPYQ